MSQKEETEKKCQDKNLLTRTFNWTCTRSIEKQEKKKDGRLSLVVCFPHDSPYFLLSFLQKYIMSAFACLMFHDPRFLSCLSTDFNYSFPFSCLSHHVYMSGSPPRAETRQDSSLAIISFSSLTLTV